jgi:tetratricopeptide (TPR) repeat protein
MDEVLEEIRRRLKTAEEQFGAESAQVMHILEELAEALRSRRETLEAVNVEARSRLLRKKLGLEIEATPTPAGPRAQKNLTGRSIILLFILSIFFGYVSIIPILSWFFGAAFGIMALYLLYRHGSLSITTYALCALAWAFVMYGVPVMLTVKPGSGLDGQIEHACSLVEQGKYRPAREELDKIINQDPRATAALLARARCKLFLEQYEGVIEDCSAAATNPECRISLALAIRGIADERLRNYDKAVEELETALKLEYDVPFRKQVYLSLGKALEALNRAADAKNYLEKAKKLPD